MSARSASTSDREWNDVQRAELSDMVGGWFVGDFSPTVLASKDAEVAIKHYAAGAYEELHHHKIATEITVIVSGRVEMMGQPFEAGAIVTLAPNEATDFRVIEDTVTVVVKLPSVTGDKYLGRA